MVGAAKSCQGSAYLEQFQRSKMDLFVAAQGVWNRGAIAGKRRGIKYDQIPARDGLFVRPGCGFLLEPIENVRNLKRTFVFQTVCRGIAVGSFKGIRAL